LVHENVKDFAMMSSRKVQQCSCYKSYKKRYLQKMLFKWNRTGQLFWFCYVPVL